MMTQMVAESEKAARAAIERFDAAARRSLVSAEHCLLKALGVIAPAILSRPARRFGLSVLMQSEPGRVNNDDMTETSLFQSGRPVVVVPYIQKDGLKLDRGVLLGRQPRGGARLQRCVAVAGQGDEGRTADRAEREDHRRPEGKSKPPRRLTSTSLTLSCPMLQTIWDL
jgi:hypothetical protein